MKYVALNKVARIDRTVASDEECKTLPYVGLEHIEKDAGHFAAEFEHKPETLLATKFRFTPRHVLYGKLRPYLNKVALPSFDGVCTTEILPIFPVEGRLDRTYLWAFLLTPGFVEWASSNVSGANLPRLSPKLLAQYEILLLPLPEQQRIAAILGRADRLRRLRRTARALGDTYLQSVFLEMFGDPVTNPMGWECEAIEGLCDRVIDYRGRTPPYSDNGIPHITASCIRDSRIDWTQCKYVSEGTYAAYMTRGLPEFGDVIFTTEAPMGETAVVNTRERFSLAQRLVLLRPTKPRVDSCYLSTLLSHRCFFPRLGQFVTGSTVFGIRSVHLVSIRIPVPPLSLQQQFACIVHKFERLRSQQREAERQAEHLFQALLHRAFRGEL